MGRFTKARFPNCPFNTKLFLDGKHIAHWKVFMLWFLRVKSEYCHLSWTVYVMSNWLCYRNAVYIFLGMNALIFQWNMHNYCGCGALQRLPSTSCRRWECTGSFINRPLFVSVRRRSWLKESDNLPKKTSVLNIFVWIPVSAPRTCIISLDYRVPFLKDTFI